MPYPCVRHIKRRSSIAMIICALETRRRFSTPSHVETGQCWVISGGICGVDRHREWTSLDMLQHFAACGSPVVHVVAGECGIHVYSTIDVDQPKSAAEPTYQRYMVSPPSRSRLHRRFQLVSETAAAAPAALAGWVRGAFGRVRLAAGGFAVGLMADFSGMKPPLKVVSFPLCLGYICK